VTARCSGNGSRVKGTRARCCPYVDVGVVSWTGGLPDVHATQRGAPAHHTYPATHAHVSSATQGPRRRAFGHGSSASGTGCVRLRCHAPGVASQRAQRQEATEQRAALTRRYSARGGDATALGHGRIGGSTAMRRW
jgi:hypothetical protein